GWRRQIYRLLEDTIGYVGQYLLASVGISLAGCGIQRVVRIKNVQHAIVRTHEDQLHTGVVSRIIAELHIGLRSIKGIGIDLVWQGWRTNEKGRRANDIAQTVGSHAEAISLSLIGTTTPHIVETRLSLVINCSVAVGV